MACDALGKWQQARAHVQAAARSNADGPAAALSGPVQRAPRRSQTRSLRRATRTARQANDA
jgi:hypothetical protein